MSRRAAPTHVFVQQTSFKKKLHAQNACRFVEVVGGQVVRDPDGLFWVIVKTHRPEPVGKWLARQTPDIPWRKVELTDDEEVALYDDVSPYDDA